jgi:beta-carotene hydroxylase
MKKPRSNPELPTLDVIGRDLLMTPRWRVVLSLSAPFALVASYFIASSLDWWLVAAGAVAILSFITYGSLSHDLVHRSLGLPRGINDALLCTIEVLMLRSGRAYRLAHLNHHARYPEAADDPEAAAAHGSLASALSAGFLFFPRLWLWAYRRYPAHRPRLLFEAAIILSLVAGAIELSIVGELVAPLVYVLLAYCGTWIVPLATAYIPHSPSGENAVFQTRRFRGIVARLIAFDHLYHLEHHLYPAVPHYRWPELARRLDPILDAAGVPIVRLVPERQQRCRRNRNPRG